MALSEYPWLSFSFPLNTSIRFKIVQEIICEVIDWKSNTCSQREKKKKAYPSYYCRPLEM